MLHDEMQTLCRVKRIDSSLVRLQDFHHYSLGGFQDIIGLSYNYVIPSLCITSAYGTI